jgi:hypothetical protein
MLASEIMPTAAGILKSKFGHLALRLCLLALLTLMRLGADPLQFEVASLKISRGRDPLMLQFGDMARNSDVVGQLRFVAED